MCLTLLKARIMQTIFTPQELEINLGENLKSLRLQKNLDQKKLCLHAGVSLTALQNLEGGRGTTTKTLTRVVHALGRQDWISALAPVVSINPLHMVRSNSERIRASGPRKLNRKIIKKNESSDEKKSRKK